MIFRLRIGVEWAEQQHFNFLLKAIAATAEKDDDQKPRKLTGAELLSVMVD